MIRYFACLKKVSRIAIAVLFAACIPASVIAGTQGTEVRARDFAIFKTQAGALAMVGDPVSDWITTDADRDMGWGGLWDTASVEMTPGFYQTTYQEGGSSYTIYLLNSNTSPPTQFGFVIRVKALAWNSSNQIDSGYIPMNKRHETVDLIKFKDATNQAFTNIRYSYQVRFIAVDGTPPPGQSFYPGDTILRNIIINPNFPRDQTNGHLGQFQQTYTAMGCTANASKLNIDMGVVSPSQLVSGPINGLPVTVSLNCSADNLGVHATMTDENMPANITDELSLTGAGQDGVAKGVSVRFLKANGTTVQYAPSSNHVDSNIAGQWEIKSETTISDTAMFTLTPQYFKMGDITPGQANAVASITFSYD